jgi:hypothetical protein
MVSQPLEWGRGSKARDAVNFRIKQKKEKERNKKDRKKKESKLSHS